MLPQRVEISESVVCQPLKDEAILLDLSNQQYFGLNEVGTFIWNELATSGDPEQVLTKLQARYAGATTVREDLESLLRDLCAAGLLRIS